MKTYEYGVRVVDREYRLIQARAAATSSRCYCAVLLVRWEASTFVHWNRVESLLLNGNLKLLKAGEMDGNEEMIGPPAGDSDFITKKSETRPAHQRLVLTDPVAFRYLEEDPSITVLERRRRLQGYELYIVEQWICSRVHPTFVITTYTGLEQHSVLVGVLSVPTDEDEWSPRLRVWFKALAKYHARRKETPLGTLMVTNLSGFPSALTVVPVPDGDVKGHREDFIVNENMKRMGCSGRAGLNLTPPTGATQAKFVQLYRTSDRIPFYGAVIELVKAMSSCTSVVWQTCSRVC